MQQCYGEPLRAVAGVYVPQSERLPRAQVAPQICDGVWNGDPPHSHFLSRTTTFAQLIFRDIFVGPTPD